MTKDEITDPQHLQVRLWNNGALMQDFNTDDMAHMIPRCIEWLTSIHTLEPGDIVATGTNHRGLNPFLDGDKIEAGSGGPRPPAHRRQGRAQAHLGPADPPRAARRSVRRVTRRSSPARYAPER